MPSFPPQNHRRLCGASLLAVDSDLYQSCLGLPAGGGHGRRGGAMNSSCLHSVLAAPFATFVQYKQALNRKYRTEAAALRLFDRYLSEHGVAGWESIDNILIDDFLKSRPRTRPRSYNHLVGVLTRFFAWAIVQGLTRCNPVSAKRRRETAQRMPYLFNLSDAKQLLELVHSLPDRSRAPHRALVYETVFSLLYGLGLRAGEVAKLKLGEWTSLRTPCSSVKPSSARVEWCRSGPGWLRVCEVT